MFLSRVGVLVLLALSGLMAGRQQEATGGCDDMWPAWSPDGRQIVFASTRTGDPEIFVLSLGASDPPTRLTFAPGRDAHPSFAPDGGRIAFQSPREPGGHTNLYTMGVDGSDLRRLTSHTGFAGMPVWSPDGRSIAYQWTPEISTAKWRLMLVGAEPGSKPRALTDGSANDQVINWAPDGQRLVFHSDRSGVNQLFTMRLDGRTQQLTRGDAPSQSGAWSPDGRTIAFKSDRDGVSSAVYVMNADGSGVRRISTSAWGHGVPFFSPDGTRVLVSPRTAAGTEVVALRLSDGGTEGISRCVAGNEL